MVFQIKNMLASTNIQFEEIQSMYSNRVPHQLKLPYDFRTQYSIKRFSYLLGPKIFNQFLQEIGRLNGYFLNMNINKFKNIIKNQILSEIENYI